MGLPKYRRNPETGEYEQVDDPLYSDWDYAVYYVHDVGDVDYYKRYLARFLQPHLKHNPRTGEFEIDPHYLSINPVILSDMQRYFMKWNADKLVFEIDYDAIHYYYNQ